MEDKNKTVAKPDDKSTSPKNETPNLPRPLTPWSSSGQASAFHNFGSTPTPSLPPASPHFYSCWFGSQMWNRPMQYGSLYQSRSFSNYPMMPTWIGQNSLLASANTMQRTSAENKTHLENQSNRSSTSNLTPKAKENEGSPSIQETNMGGLTRSVTSDSKETTVVVHDDKKDGGSTKESNNAKEQRKRKSEQTSSEISSLKTTKLQDIPSPKQQQTRMMPRTDNFEASSTDPNQNLHIDPNASAANPQLEKESDHTKEQGKLKAMAKSSKRPRIKIIKLKNIPSINQQQSSVAAGNGGGANNVTSIENRNSVQENTNIASDHFEANPTKLNRKLSTKLKASATNPQLVKEETDEAKEQRRRQSKKKSAKRSRIKMKMERERLNESIKNLDVENAALKKELHDLIDDCDKLIKNNDSLQDELNEMFGEETVMEVLNALSADLDADGDKNSNDS